jgi:hypothetical protein
VGLGVGALAAAATWPYYGYGGYPYYGYDDTAYYPYGYGVSYAAAGNGSAYCAQRFRSYDPASGTYLGYDGLRHPCP